MNTNKHSNKPTNKQARWIAIPPSGVNGSSVLRPVSATTVPWQWWRHMLTFTSVFVISYCSVTFRNASGSLQSTSCHDHCEDKRLTPDHPPSYFLHICITFRKRSCSVTDNVLADVFWKDDTVTGTDICYCWWIDLHQTHDNDDDTFHAATMDMMALSNIGQWSPTLLTSQHWAVDDRRRSTTSTLSRVVSLLVNDEQQTGSELASRNNEWVIHVSVS